MDEIRAYLKDNARDTTGLVIAGAALVAAVIIFRDILGGELPTLVGLLIFATAFAALHGGRWYFFVREAPPPPTEKPKKPAKPTRKVASTAASPATGDELSVLDAFADAVARQFPDVKAYFDQVFKQMAELAKLCDNFDLFANSRPEVLQDSEITRAEAILADLQKVPPAIMVALEGRFGKTLAAMAASTEAAKAARAEFLAERAEAPTPTFQPFGGTEPVPPTPPAVRQPVAVVPPAAPKNDDGDDRREAAT